MRHQGQGRGYSHGDDEKACYDCQQVVGLAVVAKSPGRQHQPHYESDKSDVDHRMKVTPHSLTLFPRMHSIMNRHNSLPSRRGTIKSVATTHMGALAVATTMISLTFMRECLLHR